MANTYSSTAQVKSIVWVDGWGSDTQFDSFIDTLRGQAQDEIDSKLRDYMSVSLAGTEEDYNVIVLAESLITAGYFRLARDEPSPEGQPTKGSLLLKEGRALVDMYINEHFLKDKSDVTGSREVKHQKSDKFWEV